MIVRIKSFTDINKIIHLYTHTYIYTVHTYKKFKILLLKNECCFPCAFVDRFSFFLSSSLCVSFTFALSISLNYIPLCFSAPSILLYQSCTAAHSIRKWTTKICIAQYTRYNCLLVLFLFVLLLSCNSGIQTFLMCSINFSLFGWCKFQMHGL